MNVRDSEVIAGLLIKQGYQIAADETDADILIYNTCSVRQHAEDKVWSGLGRYKKLSVVSRQLSDKKLRTKPIIGIVGCMAQNYKEKIFERAPQVDFVVGPSDIGKITQTLDKLTKPQGGEGAGDLLERKIWETCGKIRPGEIYHTGFYEDKNHAYVVISEGCSNYCSYCVVPYVRGELRNRDCSHIIREVEEAVDKGITAITLLGQNVNAYKYDNIDFIRLLELVNKIKGIREFSFITSHPKDATIKLFETMGRCDKLKKYLHLPVQSGCDRILKLMNRQYTRRGYLDLIDSYRKILKGARISTDIIVGFPGETEQEFQDTYNLVKETEFDSAYIFKYSPRLHTRASSLEDDVPKKDKERRHQLILSLQKKISKRRKSACKS